MSSRALIVGCAGPTLTDEERRFIRDAKPWGLILFARNVVDPEQVRRLTDDFRACLGWDEAVVLIDQEGGRVRRMRPPHWRDYPPGAAYGRLRANDPLTAREVARLGGRLIAADLRAVGISCDCAPVLDVPAPGAHDVIGDRAYGGDPTSVAILGRAFAEGLLAGAVLPVIKHIPGHGRALSDSHHELPVVDAPAEDLSESDFAPFRILADMPAAMTAHVVYARIDPSRPATTSKRVVRKVIRESIGFDGLLMTDDLSMKALTGSFARRAAAAVAAGCDMLLHCDGDLVAAREIAAEAPFLAGKARRRADAAIARIRHAPEPLEVVDSRARFEAALAAMA